jgi:HemY protein
MRVYRLLLGVLALALIAALTAWLIGDDPGRVLIRRGGIEVETTLVFLVLALLALWAVWALGLTLARWPLRAMLARSRRRGRMRYVRGVLALTEGRPQRAENQLLAASRLRSVRIPALIGAYQAARTRGDVKRQGELLERLGADGETEVAALVLRARAELEDGRAGTAIELLTPLEHNQRLPPAGARTLIEALAARGRAREALALLARLQRTPLMSREAFAGFESNILAQALRQASDGVNLNSLWGELGRAQRRDPNVALAYAERAAALRVGEGAARELEAVLKKQWSEALVAAWARLPGEDRAARLKLAESWARDHPGSATLLLVLGRLCREEQLWGKCEDYSRRALAAGASGAWEELGHAYAAQRDSERAARAYANALAVARGDAAATLGGRSVREDLALPGAVPEERNEHGVPVLPR